MAMSLYRMHCLGEGTSLPQGAQTEAGVYAAIEDVGKARAVRTCVAELVLHVVYSWCTAVCISRVKMRRPMLAL